MQKRSVSVSYTLRGRDGHILDSYRGDTRYYAASTMKLAVALAALRLTDDGLLPLDETLPATHTYESAAGGTFTFDPDDVDPEFPAEWTPVSVRELIDCMIDRSCNEATNMLIGRIGYGPVADACRLCRLRDMHVDRMIGDVAAVRKTGLRNEVTTDDLSSLMLQIVRGDHLGRASTDLLVSALECQRFAVIGDVVGDVVGGDVVWGSKSGWVDGINHDVAFIGEPDAPDLRVLAICTEGYGESQAHEAMHALAASLLRARG